MYTWCKNVSLGTYLNTRVCPEQNNLIENKCSTVKCNKYPTDYCYTHIYKDVNGKKYTVRGCSNGKLLPNGLHTYNLGINMICLLEIIE